MAHVFISYVHEDWKKVEKLCNSLRANDIRTWIDRNDLPAAVRWKRAIRKAIEQGDFFLACFSPNYVNRSITFMNEELTIAVESLRLRPPDRPWFIPVLLSPCEVPNREIGGGETLLDIQQVRLYDDWGRGIEQILSVVKPAESKEESEIRKEASDKVNSILFLAANPIDTPRLRVDEELREIQSRIVDSDFRDQFNLETRMAIRAIDLGPALSKIRPRIVHFAGHGTQSGELLLEDENGNAAHLDAAALASLFRTARGDGLECVVLNSCYSAHLAKAIAQEVKYVIGMSDNHSDRVAIAFSSAWYQALASGRTIEEAFTLARHEIALQDEKAQDFPVLIADGRFSTTSGL